MLFFFSDKFHEAQNYLQGLQTKAVPRMWALGSMGTWGVQICFSYLFFVSAFLRVCKSLSHCDVLWGGGNSTIFAPDVEIDSYGSAIKQKNGYKIKYVFR
jgi:hypothetical protein